MKRACTILLRAKKIKKFISMPYKGLHHFTKFFTPDFRMKRASLCKGGGAILFAPPIVRASNKRKAGNNETQLNKTGQPSQTVRRRPNPLPADLSLICPRQDLHRVRISRTPIRLRRTSRRISQRIPRHRRTPQPPAIPPHTPHLYPTFPPPLTPVPPPPFPSPILLILYISNRKSPRIWNIINYAIQTQFSDAPTVCNTCYDKDLQCQLSQNTQKIRTQSEPNPNPIQTRSKPKPNPIRTQPNPIFPTILHFIRLNRFLPAPLRLYLTFFSSSRSCNHRHCRHPSLWDIQAH